MGKEKDAQLPWSLDDMIVERNRLTDGWNFWDIKGETEGLIVAAQDQPTGTNYFKTKVLKVETENNVDCVRNMKKP
jgi:hypothetical protein